MNLKYLNTDNTDFLYQNTTEVGQNIFFTGTGGAGNVNTTYTTSGNTRYYNVGAKGVNLQIFIDDVLMESISGGDGNIKTIQDTYKHVRTENHRSKYSCGFLGLKKCWRDNWVQIWEWGHNRRAATHAAEGQSKSFVLNLPPQSTLRVSFSGSSPEGAKGSCAISVLDRALSLAFKPIDTNGLEYVEPSEIVPPSQITPQEPEAPESETPPPNPPIEEVEPSPEVSPPEEIAPPAPNPPIEENAPTEPKQS